MPSLRLKIDADQIREFALGDGDRVGRLKSCEIYLPHASVSRQHAVFHVIPEGILLEDADSSNGTFVNGERITRRMLSDGDRVKFGQVAAVFGGDASAAQGESPPRAEIDDDEWLDPDAGDEITVDERGRSAAPAPGLAARGRVLQYRKIERRGGLLNQDLAQWWWGAKLLALALVLAVCAGIFFAVKALAVKIMGG